MRTTSKKPARTKPEAKLAVVQYTQAAGTAYRPFVVHVDEERHDLGRPVRVNAAVLRLRKPPDGGQARIGVDGWRSLPDFGPAAKFFGAPFVRRLRSAEPAQSLL
jgi:hypothetical protein